MRRLLTAIFLIIFTFSLTAQLSVKDFVVLPNDLTARVTSPVTDQNGNTCALIKIVTTETGFTFDVGMLGVQKVEQHPAEIWVYVPERTAKIKIMHPTLGQFDTPDGYYWFPTGNLKSATVYRLTLISGRIITTVEERVIPTGFLIIKSEPDGADVYLTENGKESYAGTTPFQKKLQYGKYTFRVEKNLYHSEVGIAEINSDKLIMPVTLRPKFGTLQVTSNPSGARVVIEGKTQEYTTPCTISQLPSGKHSVRILKDRYTPVIQQVTIEDGKTTPLSVTLQPNFALVYIKTLPNAEVYINGKLQGEAVSNRSQTSNQLTVELAEGIYEIEARLASHETVRKQLQVVANQSQTIELTPRPIYGSLDIITTPMEATVTLYNSTDYKDGHSCGETPLSIPNLLIGEYTLTLSKAGCATLTKQISIEKGKPLNINEQLDTKTAEEYYQEAETYYKQEDYDKAFSLYMQAAEMGNVKAQNSIVYMYQYGKSVLIDYAEAAKWYRKAAEQGFAKAQCNLGHCYYYGSGVPQSYEESIVWYKKATEQGYARAQLCLGLQYLDGKGVPQDCQEAIRWIEASAMQEFTDGQVQLGTMYLYGNCVTKDYKQAVYWYRKAAEQGDSDGQANLGYMYCNGLGVTQDYHVAVSWYKKSAEQENPNGQVNLGYMYDNGLGVTQNYTKAMKLYSKAAEQGEASAQYNLATMYEDGRGVKHSKAEATKWYRKAAIQGFGLAQQKLTKLGLTW